MADELTRTQRRELVDWESAEQDIKTQAQLLGLSRSGLYYKPKPISAEELALKHKIDELHTEFPYYGSRKIAHELGINRKAAQRHMAPRRATLREMGITAIYPGPNLSRRRAKEAISGPPRGHYPYLLGTLAVNAPNVAWGIDITYIRLRTSWMYLVAILDLFSRYVVSWQMDDTLELPFVLDAVDQALTRATPRVWNSDQGSHFTSQQYVQRLKTAGVQISMDGKGRAMDNIFVERLWRSLKVEEVYTHDYMTPREARAGVTAYLETYNHRRIHQSLEYGTPAEVYATQTP